MEILTGIIVGIGSSFTASIGFLWLYISKKRPKILISPHISRTTFSGKQYFQFKFVNKTRSPIYDIKVNLSSATPTGSINNRGIMYKYLEIKHPNLNYVPKEDSKDDYNLHARRLWSSDDFDEILEDENVELQLEIIARHDVSGLTSILSKNFTKNSIKNGEFPSGNELLIK
ncbi:MAG: hypothetical protein AAF363_14480 [Bacteroidota bacterium]